MGTYSYNYLLEYVPKRFPATKEQEKERRIVWDFKDGYCPESLKKRLASLVNSIKYNEFGGNVRVCFIPASSRDRTINRYQALSSYIERETGCPCSIDTIKKTNNAAPGYIAGKQEDPAADFEISRWDVQGMNIILIDDVITRGRTFVCTADKLISSGAKAVWGLFLATTIHTA